MNPQEQRNQIARDEYQKGRDEFLSVSWLNDLSEKEKSESLGKFFDDKTSVYLKESRGITDEKKMREYRDTFIGKYGGVKKKESTLENGGLYQEPAKQSLEKQESTKPLGIYEAVSELPNPLEAQKEKMSPALKQLDGVSEVQREAKVDEYDKMSPIERLNVAQSPEGVPITKEREVFLRETSLPPTDIEVNTANDILKGISSKYIGQEGKVSKIGGKDYENSLYKSIDAVAGDMNSFQKERIFKVINSELRAENEKNLQKISEDNLDKKFLAEVGEETYNKIKKEITNPVLTQESDIFNDVEFLYHVRGTNDELFSESYIQKAVKNNNYEWGGNGILANPTQSEYNLRKKVKSGDKNAIELAYRAGFIGVKNPMFGDEYKPIAQRLINSNVKEAGANLESAAIEERVKIGGYGSNPKVDLDIEVGDYMEQFMRPEEVTAKMYNNQLYQATIDGQSEEDIQKIIKLRDMALGNKSEGEEIYDPRTGAYINRKKASPDILDWNKEVDKYAIKYTKDLNQKEDLVRIRTRLYFEKQYLEGEINKRQSQIKAPLVDFNSGKSEENMPLFGGSLLLDKYKENHQRLLAVNTVLTQNVNPATIERSLTTTFGEALSETLGVRQQTLQDIPRDFVAGMDEKGAFVSKAQRERVKTTIGEEIASGTATTIPELVKFMAASTALGALGVEQAVASYFTTMKGMTTSNTIKDVFSAIEPLLMTEGTFQLAGQDFGTGLGEEVGGQAYDALGLDKLISKIPGVGKLKASLSTVLKLVSRSGGEMSTEYIGELFTRILDDNEDFGEALKNTVGEDPFKKLVSIYVISGTLSLGFAGSDYKQALKNIESNITNYDTTDPENIATQEEIKEKVKQKEEVDVTDVKKDVKEPEVAEKIKDTKAVENEIKKEETPPKEEVVETPIKGEQQVTDTTEVETSKETQETEVLQPNTDKSVKEKTIETLEKDLEGEFVSPEAKKEIQGKIDKLKLEVKESSVEKTTAPEVETKVVEEPKQTLEEFTTQNPIEKASGKVFNLPDTNEGLYKVSPKKTKSGRVILESESGQRKTFTKKEFQQKRFDGSITESKPKTDSVVFESKSDPRYSLIKEDGELKVFNKAKGKVVNRSKNKKALVEEYKQSIIPELQKGKKVEYPEGAKPTEVESIKDVIKDSENPTEVASTWLNSKKLITSEPTLDDIIADNLPKITPDTFNESGDRNLVTPAIRLNYFTSKAKGGVSLDMAARQIMEEGMLSSESEVAGMDEKDIIQSIIDFITANQGGTRTHNKKQTLTDELASKFTELTGLDIDNEFAQKITDYKVEDKPILEPRELEESEKKQLEKQISDKKKIEEIEEAKRLKDIVDKNKKANGDSISLDEAKELRKQGVTGGNLDAQLKEQAEKVKEAIRKSRGNLNMGAPIDFNSLKEISKYIKLWSVKNGKNVINFLKEIGASSIKWVKDLFNDIVVKGINKIRVSKGYSPLLTSKQKEQSGIKGLTTAKSLEMYNEYIGELTNETTSEGYKDAITELIVLNDIQQANTTNKDALINLKESREALIELYKSIRTKSFEEATDIIKKEVKEVNDEFNKDWMLNEEVLSEWIQRKLTDKTNPLRIIQDSIEKSKGEKLTPEQDIHTTMDLENGKVKSEIDNLIEWVAGKRTGVLGKQKIKNSFVSRLKDFGIKLDDLGTYMMARHVPERNVRLKAIREKAFADKKQQLESDLSDGKLNEIEYQSELANIEAEHTENMKYANTGMSSENAVELQKKLEEKYGKEKLKEFADEFTKKIIHEKINILERGGVISNETAIIMKDGKGEGIDFENYVPMKVSKTIIDEIYEATGQLNKMSSESQPLKGLDAAAKSGKLKAFERVNPIYQSLYDLFEAHKIVETNNTRKALKDLVKENPNPKLWGIVTPYTRDSKIADGSSSEFVPVRSVNEKGKEVTNYIELKGDAIKAVFKQQKGKDKFVKSFLKGWNSFNNLSRSLYTTYNISFGLPNLIRDLQDVLFNLSAEGAKKMRRKVLKNLPKAILAVTSYEKGYDTELAKQYEESISEGAQVSWMDLNDVDNTIDAINKEIKGVNSKNPIKAVTKGLLMFNNVMEQGTRFAVYKSAIESGYSKQEAAALSKNITINFSRKGEWGQFLNTLWLFSNAGIQGLDKSIRTARSKGGKKAAVALIGLGFAQAMLRDSLISDDEERDYLLTKYDTKNNFIFPVGNGKAITIPKSYSGFKIFANIGEYLYEGQKTGNISDVITNTSSDLVGMIDIVGGGAENIVSKFSPEPLKPIMEILNNRNYMDKPITPESPFSTPKRDVEKYYKDTEEPYKDIAKSMYNVVDASPETYKHLFKGYIWKGALTDVDRIYNIFNKTMKGEEIKTSEIPIYRRFVKDYIDEQGWRGFVIVNDMYNESPNRMYNKNEIKKFYDLLGEMKGNPSRINTTAKVFYQNEMRLYKEKGKELEFEIIMAKIFD